MKTIIKAYRRQTMKLKKITAKTTIRSVPGARKARRCTIAASWEVIDLVGNLRAELIGQPCYHLDEQTYIVMMAGGRSLGRHNFKRAKKIATLLCSAP